MKATACACGNTLALTFTTEVEGQPPCAQRGAQACKGGRARHAGDREAIRM